MKTEIINYDPVHVDKIMENNPRSVESRFAKMKGWGDWNKYWRVGGPGFTLIIDDKIIGCAGIVFRDEETGEAWSVLSNLVNQYPKAAFVALLNGLESIATIHRLKKVLAYVEPEFALAHHLMTHLGFTLERQGEFGPDGEQMLEFVRRF